MKFRIFKFSKVTSTNDVAIKLIKKEKKLFGFVYADMQSKGRGTKGRRWISQKGNFFGSIFFPLGKKYPPFHEFTVISPVIISKTIKNFCKKKNINIKFPNDIFVNKKKICGILQEVVTFNDKQFLITGIGLNLISNPLIKNNYETTNILLETKKIVKVREIIDLIVLSYENFFIDLNSYKYTNFKQKADAMAIY